MTFDSYEEGTSTGRPIVLYKFTRGAQEWLYTSADAPFVHAATPLTAADIYAPVAISDGGIVQSNEPTQDTVAITMPWGLPLPSLYIGMPPAQSVAVRIFRTQMDDPDGVIQLSWVGTVTAVKKSSPGEATLQCNTLAHSFRRNGLRLGWQRTCPFVLYDPRTCKVVKASFATPATISAIVGNTITATAFASLASGKFASGFVEWAVDGLGTYERRSIESHAGNQITLMESAEGLTVGQTITAYRGCDRLIQTCQDDFNNRLNSGGVPMLPGRSPFDGNPVF